MLDGHKAPSAKRCIKTVSFPFTHVGFDVVTKHRAPKGALRRHVYELALDAVNFGHKAPSAKRCIKTGYTP